MGMAPGSLPPCPAQRKGGHGAGLRGSGLDTLKDSGRRGLPWGCPSPEAGAEPGQCPARFVSTRCLLHLPPAQACFDQVPKAQQLRKLTWHFGKCSLQVLRHLGSTGVRC